MWALNAVHLRAGEQCIASTSTQADSPLPRHIRQYVARQLGRSPIFTRDAGRESLSKPHHLARLCNNGRRARETAVHVRAYAYAPVLGLQPVVSFSLAKLVANVLGYGVLVGSCVRSAPQIIKILKGQSALGLSVSAQIMELLTYNVTVAYNVRLGYHFVTYGEVLTCWLQDAFIMFLILQFNDMVDWKAYLGTALFVGSLWLLSIVPMNILAGLQAGTILLKIGGRFPQIVMNWKRGDSGQLSGLMCALNLAGNLARIVTTAVLTQDLINLVASVIQAAMNATLLLQTTMRPRRSLALPAQEQNEFVPALA